jgi:hypothetical protein
MYENNIEMKVFPLRVSNRLNLFPRISGETLKKGNVFRDETNKTKIGKEYVT